MIQMLQQCFPVHRFQFICMFKKTQVIFDNFIFVVQLSEVVTGLSFREFFEDLFEGFG